VPVAVVTDTTHYMPDEVVERHRLHSVPLYVTWNGRTQRESELANFDAFYDHLRSSSELPTTSQPSIGDFLAVYGPLLDSGHDILSVHLSAGLSGTCAAAEQARLQLVEGGLDPARLVVLDSATVCAGLGLMAIAAANAVAEGADVATAAERARALRAELKIWFAVETMEFLRRGGRIGMAAAWVGSTLRIKPILTLESQVEPVERVRTWARAFDRLLAHLAQRHENGHDTWIVQHIQAGDQVEKMIERGSEIFGAGPEFVSEIGPVIGTHAGPGVLGVAAFKRELAGPV
jgi:DegV family protein with EDD domain